MVNKHLKKLSIYAVQYLISWHLLHFIYTYDEQSIRFFYYPNVNVNLFFYYITNKRYCVYIWSKNWVYFTRLCNSLYIYFKGNIFLPIEKFFGGYIHYNNYVIVKITSFDLVLFYCRVTCISETYLNIVYTFSISSSVILISIFFNIHIMFCQFFLHII